MRLYAERDGARGDAFWFGAELVTDHKQVWFRIDSDAMLLLLENTPEDTPEARGERLVTALFTWLSDDPERQLEAINKFQVLVSDGDTRVEPYGD